MRAAFGVHHALNPDPYRGRHGNDGAAYAADVADLIASATSGRVAGFVHETVQVRHHRSSAHDLGLTASHFPTHHAALRQCCSSAVPSSLGPQTVRVSQGNSF